MAWGCDPGGGEASDTRCIHVWKAVRSWRPRRRMPEVKRYAGAERERRKGPPLPRLAKNGEAVGRRRAPRLAWGCDPGGGEASDTRCIHVWKAVRSWRPRRRMPEFKRYAVAERERRKRQP